MIDTFFPYNTMKFNEIDDCNLLWITLDSTTPASFIKRICLQFGFTKKLYVFLWKWYLKQHYGPYFSIIGNPWDIPFDDLFYLRISWGCSNKCSYCAIRKGVGKLQSKPFEKCVQEFKSGLDQGFIKFHITAVDPGSYGVDIHRTYPELLDTLTSYDAEFSIALDCVNPKWLVRYINEIEDILKRKKIEVMSVPIQSGNSRILQMMNRYSDVDEIRNALKRVKIAYPEITLYTNFIIGFPTETQEEFKDSLDFLLETDIDMGILNPLSIKQGTEIQKLEPRVSQTEIIRRIDYGKDFLQDNGYKTITVKGGLVLFSKFNKL